MAGQNPCLGANLPYPFLVDRNVTADNAARPRTEQRRIIPRWLRLSLQEQSDLGEDLRRVDHVPVNRDRALYPPSQRQYDDLDPLIPGPRERSYHSPPPYDAVDEGLDPDRRGRRLSRDPPPYDAAGEELGFSRRGRQPLRDPPQYDAEMKSGRRRRRPDSSPPSYTAANDQFAFDNGRNGRAPKRKSWNDRLPFPPRDTGFGNLDEASFRGLSLGPRDSYSRRGSHTSRDRDLNPMDGLRHRVQQGRDSQRNEHYGYSEMAMMSHLCGGGSFHNNFPDQKSEQSLHGVDARPLFRPHRIGHRSDLDFESPYDGVKDDFTGSLRPPTAEEINHRKFLVRMHGSFDAEDRQKAQIQERYTHEDSEIVDSGRGRRDRYLQLPQATGPNPAASLFLHPGRRAIQIPPRRPGNRQTTYPDGNIKTSPFGNQHQHALLPAQTTALTPPKLNPNTDHSSRSLSPANRLFQKCEAFAQQELKRLQSKSRITDCHARRPPPHGSVTATQLKSPAPTNLANDPGTLATTSNDTLPSPTEELPRSQQHPPHTPPIHPHPKNNPTPRDTVDATNDTVNPSAVPQKTSTETVQMARADERVRWGSDSSDNGYDTPDEGSEGSVVGGGDDGGEGGGGILETLVRIEL